MAFRYNRFYHVQARGHISLLTSLSALRSNLVPTLRSQTMTMNSNALVLNGNSDANKFILQANIPFIALNDNRVRFTYMSDPSLDPYAFDSDDLEALSRQSSQSFYQRRVNEDRVKEIKKFIYDSILDEYRNRSVSVIFPTALLLAVNSDMKIDPGMPFSVNDLLDGGKQFFIVDGQHRLYSMMQLYKDVTNPSLLQGLLPENEIVRRYLESYRFNCTILLNFDLWEQAKIFADVNFNQKKVDRSLYYSIYGMNYTNDPEKLRNNYIFIAHQLVKYLNSSANSPLKGMVRMLGNGKGVISQAFLADALIRHIRSPRGIWFVDSALDKTHGNYKYMAKEIITFFTAIKNLLPDCWPSSKGPQSILLKTTGLGALIRLMGYIHKNYLSNEIIAALDNQESNEYVVKEYYDRLKEILPPIVRKRYSLFSFDGEFAGTGGRGLESRLYNEMIHLLQTVSAGFIEQKSFMVNGISLKANIYQNANGMYFFELSHYFQNPDQMAPYIPGSGSIAESKEHIDFKLQLYVDQIQPAATSVANPGFVPINGN